MARYSEIISSKNMERENRQQNAVGSVTDCLQNTGTLLITMYTNCRNYTVPLRYPDSGTGYIYVFTTDRRVVDDMPVTRLDELHSPEYVTIKLVLSLIKRIKFEVSTMSVVSPLWAAPFHLSLSALRRKNLPLLKIRKINETKYFLKTYNIHMCNMCVVNIFIDDSVFKTEIDKYKRLKLNTQD